MGDNSSKIKKKEVSEDDLMKPEDYERYKKPEKSDFKIVFRCDTCRKEVVSLDSDIYIENEVIYKRICPRCEESHIVHKCPIIKKMEWSDMYFCKSCDCKKFVQIRKTDDDYHNEFEERKKKVEEEEEGVEWYDGICRCGHTKSEHLEDKKVTKRYYSKPYTMKLALKFGCYEEGKTHEPL